MSRVMSSQGGRSPAISTPQKQLTLEEMRQRMLFRRPVDLHLNRVEKDKATLDTAFSVGSHPTSRHHVFVGRSIPISNTPPNPRSATVDESDPQKLFQMLRKKKRNLDRSGVSTPAQATTSPEESPDRSEPHPLIERAPLLPEAPPMPPTEPQPPRPQAAFRPPAPGGETVARQSSSAGPSTSGLKVRRASMSDTSVSSAAMPDGRPCTRQKPLSQSLDLFPARTEPGDRKTHDPFPRPVLNGATRKPAAGRQQDESLSTTSALAGGVNFNCLFVSDDCDLDGSNQEFPSPKTHVDIPLIETDWFTNATWEEVLDPDRSNAADASCLEEDSSHSLYELLIAQKNRRSRRI